MSKSIARVYRSRISKFFLLLGPIVIAAGLLLFQISVVQSAAGLTVEILAGYNLVVDSNVASQSTDSPSVATIAARFCNPVTNADTLHDVIGYIGDYTSVLATSTPGVYPIRTSGDPGFDTIHPRLAGTGPYSFTHLGEVSDASRFIGDLAPGQCSVQYWSFSYPRCENNEAPPCSGDTVYGVSNNLADDLYLYFDVWGQGTDPSDQTTKTADATHRLTMRSEISASANQIWPNGGSWFNTNASTVLPGDVITSNGVNYTFGNVSGGFDNDNDGLPDNNAWIQPFGDPTYDPNCFRLIRTTVILTQTLTGNQQRVDTYVDQLYFKLASNNTNVIGEVHYTFLALGGVCTADMSPYQEAASGSNNEKFNSDYGTAVPPLVSNPPQATVDKTATASVSEGEMITYAIPFANTGSTPIGLIQFGEPPVNINLPFVVEDTVPDGLSYVCGSPSATLDFAGGYTLLFSKDSGMTWSSSETGLWPECGVQGTPTTQVSAGPNNSILIQWRLNEPLPPGGAGTATFQAYVPVGYIQAGGSPVIQNTACIKLDNVEKIFGCASDTTTVGGPNSLNGTVFFDQVNQDGIRDPGDTTVFAGITINLWYCGLDRDCNTAADNFFVGSTVTDASGGYTFTNLPDGVYSVSIDTSASSISLMSLTSPSPQTASLDPLHAANDPVSATRDFGLYAHMDCGDLLNTYNYRTTLDQEGPCHISPSTPLPSVYLGDSWDNDYNGQGTDGWATGDDTSGDDDEDGVEPIDFANWYLGGTRQVSVYVTGANGYLAGWFDWNNDLDFVDNGGYDPGEFINFGPVVPGVNTLNLTVPVLDCTNPGTFCFDSYDTLYARFRLFDSTTLPVVITHTGLARNGEVEDYRFANAPTAVTVSDFSATYRPIRIVINWETALELDTLGFNILRSTSLDGERVQINDQLIPSQAPGGFGGTYEFVDLDIQPGVTYYYWLEFVESSGEPTPPVGPVQALAERTVFIPLIRK